MKIQIICESCNCFSELIPSNIKNEVSIHSAEKNFIIGLDWDSEIKDNFQDEFIEELSGTTSFYDTKQLLFHDLNRNIYTETSDFDICFTCKGCGEQIILNEFAL